MLKSRAQRFRVLECEGGRGLFIYTADEYPLAHIDSGTFFSLISNDIFREGVVCWQKIFLCLHISKFNKIIGPYY